MRYCNSCDRERREHNKEQVKTLFKILGNIAYIILVMCNLSALYLCYTLTRVPNSYWTLAFLGIIGTIFSTMLFGYAYFENNKGDVM